MLLCDFFPALLITTFGCNAFVVPLSPSPSSDYLAIAQNTIISRQGSLGRPNNDTLNQERADAVRDAFTFAFNGYWEVCKGQDELLPVGNTCSNPRYSI